MNRVTFVLTECVPSYERLIKSQAEQIEAQTKAVRTASAAVTAERAVTAEEHDRAERHLREAREEHALYIAERDANASVLRSPVFWMFVGFVAGAGATIGITAAVVHVLDGRVP